MPGMETYAVDKAYKMTEGRGNAVELDEKMKIFQSSFDVIFDSFFVGLLVLFFLNISFPLYVTNELVTISFPRIFFHRFVNNT